jgi:hypothetical protein
MTTPIESGYAAINGLEVYYEIHGSGKLLVMLHGGIAASEAFGPSLPLLAESRQVVAVHLQGHGRTRDIDRPLRYESMADDVAALITHHSSRLRQGRRARLFTGRRRGSAGSDPPASVNRHWPSFTRIRTG